MKRNDQLIAEAADYDCYEGSDLIARLLARVHELEAERNGLLNVLRKLRDHCNGGAWAGVAKRATVVADLAKADDLLAAKDYQP